jgi:16S rRNA (adenine1518-N6/adenine1519-N6)-dimethyltransferase
MMQRIKKIFKIENNFTQKNSSFKPKKSLGLKEFSPENSSPETKYFKPKKSLGQNFLKSEPALMMMATAGEINHNDIILEIGPGKGALTTKLLVEAKKVLAIEKDRELFDFLKEKFSNEIKKGSLEIINDDILSFEIKNYGLRKGKYKIIANIPYNITGAIFKKFLSTDIQPERMIILVQKEVAKRIVARDGKESILSLSVKAYGTPKYIMKVGKRFFSPEPKVDSAIIEIIHISKNNFQTKKEEENYFKIVRAGFAHKRKVLRKNLEEIDINAQNIEKTFEKLKIDPKTRAEDLKIETWLELSRNLSTDI